jgi:hypothetical protein
MQYAQPPTQHYNIYITLQQVISLADSGVGINVHSWVQAYQMPTTSCR